jgi:hypothetical protein
MGGSGAFCLWAASHEEARYARKVNLPSRYSLVFPRE